MTLRLPGRAYQASHQDSVNAVLGSENAPVVRSQGGEFYNRDRWTTIAVVDALSTGWTGAGKVNVPAFPAAQKGIWIAQMPDKIGRSLALAMTGGAYHEALHTHYDRVGVLTLAEEKFFKRALKARPWAQEVAKAQKARLLTWNNVLLDVRLERLGCRDFPGMLSKLEHLADFVCEKESEIYDRASDMDFLLMIFRDLGKGYQTPRVQRALADYRRLKPAVYQMVAEGSLSGLLRKSQGLGVEDNFESILIALDLLKTLQNQSEGQGQDQGSEDQDQDNNQGEGQDQGSEDREGGSQGQGSQSPSEGQGQDQDGEDSEGQGSGGQGSEGDSEENQSAQSGDSEENQGSQDGSEAGNSQDGDGKSSDSKGSQDSDASSNSGEEQKEGAGAGDSDPGQTAWRILRGGEDKITGSYEEIFKKEVKKEYEKNSKNLKPGERIWNPHSTAFDRIERPVADRARALPRVVKEMTKLAASVRPQTSGLRTKLRRLVKASEMVGVVHGTKKGRGISQRYLVDSVVSMRRGKMPSRAYYQRDEAKDNSLAAFLSVDMSGSMCCHLGWLKKFILCMTEALDGLRCPTMVAGFKENYSRRVFGLIPSSPWGGETHRGKSGVDHIIFKNWKERAASEAFKTRLGTLSIGGGTPTADGVQFGLEALNTRKEGKRVLFVLTDGLPGSSHIPVLRYQQRIAREQAGIHIVGLGMGEGAKKVRKIFDDHVWVREMEELPPLMIEKLSEIMLGTKVERKRGRKVRSVS